MKAAIIGAGFAAKLHAEAIRKTGVELALVATSNEESAARAKEELHVPRAVVCQNGVPDEALFGDEIDAVHICTPPLLHAAYAKELIAHGKHVLLEKPLSTDAKEAEALSQFAEKSNVVTALVLNVRYHAACRKAKEIIQSGELGKPLLIHGSYLQEFHALPCPYDWRYRTEVAGQLRAVTEIGTHWFDIAEYISGRKIEAVSATLNNFFPERRLQDGLMFPVNQENDQKGGDPLTVTSEDTAAVTLRFEGGAYGNVLLSEISAGRGNRLYLEIACEKGNLWWNEEDNNRLYTAKKGEGIHEELFAFGNGFGDTFESLVRDFYENVRMKKRSISETISGTKETFSDCPDFRTGARIARICEAVRQSSLQSSAWVAV